MARTVFSLSHVRAAVSADDPLYGYEPVGETKPRAARRIEVRGENGVLTLRCGR